MVAPLEASAQDQPWDIEGIQRRLSELGYEAGEVDGLLGSKTRAALRAFQADSDLPVNGLPDGPTQDALFAPEPPESAAVAPAPPESAAGVPAPPESAAGVPAPSDDPPLLEAVPLEPVSAAPLATRDSPKPQEGFSVDRPPAEAPNEPAPSESAATGLASAQATETAETVETRPRKKWLTWSAAALGGLGLVLLFAALRGRSRKREQAAAEPPRPAAAEAPQPVAVAPSGVGHVFGVDVPHTLRASEQGKRGSGGAG